MERKDQLRECVPRSASSERQPTMLKILREAHLRWSLLLLAAPHQLRR